MPIRYWILTELELTYARWSERVDLSDVLTNWAVYTSDPKYRPGRPELVDLSALEDVDWDVAEMRRFIGQVNAQDFGDITATLTVVLAPSARAFGLARQYQTLASMMPGITVRLYRTGRDALDALGLPEATLPDLRAQLESS